MSRDEKENHDEKEKKPSQSSFGWKGLVEN